MYNGFPDSKSLSATESQAERHCSMRVMNKVLTLCRFPQAVNDALAYGSWQKDDVQYQLIAD